jgi:(R)-2-hydroxyglutarate---pyruvate transhydrogenase
VQCFKYDVSLPPSSYYKVVEDTQEEINKSDILSQEEKEAIYVNGYGHVGDGNLHLNISLPGYDDKDLQ